MNAYEKQREATAESLALNTDVSDEEAAFRCFLDLLRSIEHNHEARNELRSYIGMLDAEDQALAEDRS